MPKGIALAHTCDSKLEQSRHNESPAGTGAPSAVVASGIRKLARVALPRGRSQLAYALMLWSPVAVLAVVAKISKVRLLAPSSGLRVTLATCTGEILFAVIGYAVALYGLRSRKTAWRAATVLALHLALPVFGTLLVAEHVFFRITHAIPDWYVLKEAVRELPHLTKLLRSQLTALRILLLSLPWILSATVYVGYRLGPESPYHQSPPARGGGRAVAVVFMWALGVFLLDSARMPPQLAPANHGVLPALFVDIARDIGDTITEAVRRRSNHPATVLAGPRRLIRETAGPTKNVIVIVLESVGARYTSLHGKYPTTPVLRNLAASGAEGERVYTVIPHTSKALVSIVCGIYPRVEIGSFEASPGGIPVRCLPNLLREHGYATAFFQPAEEKFERRSDLVREMGFERFVGKESLNGAGFDESSYFGWEDDAMIAPFSQWLDQQGERPFFATVLTLASHHPYVVPRGFPVTSFVNEAGPLNDYLNTVAYSDRFVGKLLAELDRRGRRADTLVVVLGDHGEGFGQHGPFQHDLVPFEEGLHIPLVLAGPAVVPQTKIGGLRQTIDLAPTISGMLGFRGDTPFLGQDLLRAAPHDRLFFSCYTRQHCLGMLEQNLKIIHYYDRTPNQVFDLASDPEEKVDLVGLSGAALIPKAAATARTLKQWRERTDESYELSMRRLVPQFVTKTRPTGVAVPAEADFADFVHLIGYSITPSVVAFGEPATITTYYEVKRDAPGGWELFLHLEGPARFLGDHVPLQGGYPVSRWQKGDFIEDRYTWNPDRGLLKYGSYRVSMGFWRPATDGRAEIRNVTAPLVAGADHRLQLGTIDVRAPIVDPGDGPRPSPRRRTASDIRFGDWIRLVAAGIERQKVKPGLKVNPRLDFQVLQPLDDRFELKVDVVGPSSREVNDSDSLRAWPLSKWRRGQVVRDDHAFTVQDSDPVGSYRILVSLFDKKAKRRVGVGGKGLPIADDRVQVATFEIGR